MRSILSERNLVVILFVMVLITFSFAQQDSKKMTKFYSSFEKQSSIKMMGVLSAKKTVNF